MAETLADFARALGVTPATARQWKRRGKIVTCDGGFALAAGVTVGAVTHCGVTRDSVHRNDDPLGITNCAQGGVIDVERQPDSVPPTLAEQVYECRDRLEACERDNAALQRLADGLRDRISALEVRRPAPARVPVAAPIGRNGRPEFDWAQADPEHIA